jgi:hypothetical protein
MKMGDIDEYIPKWMDGGEGRSANGDERRQQTMRRSLRRKEKSGGWGKAEFICRNKKSVIGG